MPLPHFLLLLVAVIAAAALTIWAAFFAGVPVVLLGLVALIAGFLTHLAGRLDAGPQNRPASDGHYHLPDDK